MSSLNLLNEKITSVVNQLTKPEVLSKEVLCTYGLIYSLGEQPNWGSEERRNVAILAKRIEIDRAVHTKISQDGRKIGNDKVTESLWLELIVAIILKRVILLSIDDVSDATKLKNFNVLFKIRDIHQPNWLIDDTVFRSIMNEEWKNLTIYISDQRNLDSIPSTECSVVSGSEELQEIPLTVLFYEGPIARAYLATMHSLGLKPQKIIQLIAGKNLSTNKPVGRWLPSGIKREYAANLQKKLIHFWPQKIIKDEAEFTQSILNNVEMSFGFANKTLTEAISVSELNTYTDDLDQLLIDNLNDKTLLEYLNNEPSSAMLFTGGGILPRSVLSLPHLKFVHIHPGYLPNIRGADCTLWSTYLTGNTSATSFYMDPGIDMGDILQAHWLPRLHSFKKLPNRDHKFLYRATYSFIDPWVRSFALRELLVQYKEYVQIPSAAQKVGDGETFYFMHQNLRDEAIKLLFSV